MAESQSRASGATTFSITTLRMMSFSITMKDAIQHDVVYAECRVFHCYAECHIAKCRHAECRGTKKALCS